MEEPFLDKLQERARAQGLSINQYCLWVLSQANASLSESWLHKVKKYYGDRLLGIALFGSYARGTQSETSDKDILFVMDSKVPLKATLYREWEKHFEDKFDPLLSPHFSHLPSDLESLGSLWLELSLDAKILWDRMGHFQKTLQGIKLKILEGHYVRRHSHGVPYWVKPTRAEVKNEE